MCDKGLDEHLSLPVQLEAPVFCVCYQTCGESLNEKGKMGMRANEIIVPSRGHVGKKKNTKPGEYTWVMC